MKKNYISNIRNLFDVSIRNDRDQSPRLLIMYSLTICTSMRNFHYFFNKIKELKKISWLFISHYCNELQRVRLKIRKVICSIDKKYRHTLSHSYPYYRRAMEVPKLYFLSAAKTCQRIQEL